MPERPLFGLFTKEGRERRQYTRLRNSTQLAMGMEYLHRRKDLQPTEEEEAIGVLREQLEPQVREAVFAFNRKGYKTVSSGFDGYYPERQIMEGNFLLDDETKGKLTAMGATVTTEPWWKWQMKERMGIADPDVPEEEEIITAIRFHALRPDLLAIEAQWKEITDILPDRKGEIFKDQG